MSSSSDRKHQDVERRARMAFVRDERVRLSEQRVFDEQRRQKTLAEKIGRLRALREEREKLETQADEATSGSSKEQPLASRPKRRRAHASNAS
jgi:hypothetical protein